MVRSLREVGLVVVAVLSLTAAAKLPQVGAGTEASAGALPEDLTSYPVRSFLGMVVSNSPDATRIGVEILEAGGNAVDAAVATAFALGVAEPGAAGLGGHAYLLVRLATGESFAIDGSSFTPRQAPLDQLQDLQLRQQVWGAPTIAVPTAPAALDLALKRFGTMPLQRILAPVIALAEHGVAMPPTQRAFLEHYLPSILESDFLAERYLRDGIELHEPERVFCQPELARTLRRVAEAGIEDFYRGEIAARIEADMIAFGSGVRREDLARVRPAVKPPVMGRFRDVEVLSFPFPGGGDAVVGALATIDRFPPELLLDDSPDAFHLLLEAVRLAQADALLAGEGRRTLPFATGLAERSRGHRARQIRFDRCLTREEISDREEFDTWADSATTHLSVADRHGNMVTATVSLGRNFGSCVVSPDLGISWNSLLSGARRTDYGARGLPRPWQPIRTLMAPTLVVRDGRPLLVLGSQSSGRITGSLVEVIINVVDRGLTLEEAVARPRTIWNGLIDGKVYMEMAPPNSEALTQVLRERGFWDTYELHFPADPINLAAFGGVNAIMMDPVAGTLIGVGDPRRFGVARAPCPERMSETFRGTSGPAPQKSGAGSQLPQR